MTVIEVNPGEKIAYSYNATSITFGADDLTINLKNRERDEPADIDICADPDGYLVIGVATGYRYVAQILIPAREYEPVEESGDGEDGDDPEPVPVPFDIERCTLWLWALEG